jgi:hypothetical protein
MKGYVSHGNFASTALTRNFSSNGAFLGLDQSRFGIAWINSVRQAGAELVPWRPKLLHAVLAVLAGVLSVGLGDRDYVLGAPARGMQVRPPCKRWQRNEAS